MTMAQAAAGFAGSAVPSVFSVTDGFSERRRSGLLAGGDVVAGSFLSASPPLLLGSWLPGWTSVDQVDHLPHLGRDHFAICVGYCGNTTGHVLGGCQGVVALAPRLDGCSVGPLQQTAKGTASV